uniref:Neuregulin 2a n=1 Tax=Cyprinus carpio TaxID=7962 RepID=A0A8C1STN8_CYPCA
MKNSVSVDEGSKLIVRCEASGNPTPQYKWYKDGTELKKSKEIKISRNGKKTSKVQISSAKLEDSGNYTCVAENILGKENGTSTVHVQSITTTLSPGSGHARRCNESEKAYCVNGGDCYYIHGINRLSCKCPDGYFGQRCLQTEPLKLYMPKPNKNTQYLYQGREILAHGQLYLQLSLACETPTPPCRGQNRRIYTYVYLRRLTDVCICSTQPSSLPLLLALLPLSTVSLSLPFSLHRYVSALTTPARLSPVDFHYSLPPQVPTFQITSPNASHAMSLPPAVHAPYPPEEDQPLLRRYQVPLHEARVHEPYRQKQRGSYLRDSTGSLPSSPYRLAQEEDYESTQEYLSSMEQPKRSSRHWRRSRLNCHVAPHGYQPSRDLGSRSCLSDSDSEEEEGESTPFLSMQNMNAAEPVTLYRPVPDMQTSHAQRGRHGPRANTQTRLTQSRSKLDNAPH